MKIMAQAVQVSLNYIPNNAPICAAEKFGYCFVVYQVLGKVRGFPGVICVQSQQRKEGRTEDQTDLWPIDGWVDG